MLNLFSNKVRDIKPLAQFKGLQYLDISSNPLDRDAHKIYIPQIIKNNPGIKMLSDQINVSKP